MTYEDQIKIIMAAKNGFPILGRKKEVQKDWDYLDNRIRDKRVYYSDQDILFNFRYYEYKIAKENQISS